MIRKDNQLLPLLSPYLLNGYKQDEFVLESVERITPKIFKGILKAKNVYKQEDGSYHLSAVASYLWGQQLAIAAACIDNNLSKKEGEVILLHADNEYKRMIIDADSIEVILTIKSRKQRKQSVIYMVEISFDNGAFFSKATFLFPVPDQIKAGCDESQNGGV